MTFRLIGHLSEELKLLEDHALELESGAEECSDCLWKHINAVAGYANELASQLTGEGKEYYGQLAQEARKWRKDIFATCETCGTQETENPELEKCEFTKEMVKPKDFFDPTSFRTLCPECPGARCAQCPPDLECASRIIIGCKAGEFKDGKCRIGTETHVIYHTKGPKG